MAELKNTFTAGKMNKDLDERIIPSTEYREALNIGVATSESSDVGAAQNILGNIKLSCAIQGPSGKYSESSKHIAATVDPLTDNIYRFVSTNGNLPSGSESHVWMDRIIEFDTKVPFATPCSSVENGRVVANKEQAVLIDIWKVKTNATGSNEECDGANTTVDVNKNIFQIRHGMLAYTDSGSIEGGDGISDYDEVYVKSVEILTNTTAKITLNKALGFVITSSITLEADRVLNFSPNRYITGINVLDGMIFWTDNYSEPKKINIERSRAGCVVSRTNPALNYGLQNFDQHTRLVVSEINPKICIKQSPSICDEPIIVNDGKVYGCMDSTAFNYDPLATSMSSGDCCYIEGCMDPLYVEFDPLACENNSSMCLTLISSTSSPCSDCNAITDYNWNPIGTFMIDQLVIPVFFDFANNPGSSYRFSAYTYNGNNSSPAAIDNHTAHGSLSNYTAGTDFYTNIPILLSGLANCQTRVVVTHRDSNGAVLEHCTMNFFGTDINTARDSNDPWINPDNTCNRMDPQYFQNGTTATIACIDPHSSNYDPFCHTDPNCSGRSPMASWPGIC
jgi:hypothetical protein